MQPHNFFSTDATPRPARVELWYG